MKIDTPTAFGSDGPSAGVSDESVLDPQSELTQMMVDTAVDPQPAPAEDVDHSRLQEVARSVLDQVHPGVDEVMLQMKKTVLELVMLDLLRSSPQRTTPFSYDEIKEAITKAVRKLFGVTDESMKQAG